MDYDPGSASQDVRDEDEDEESEEVDGGNRLLGFMFGNVDNSGDLDVDYLDEDAKEHLAALANELSLKDIDLSAKSPQIPADTAEQDYDEKAEDAVDYEDFDEQYEGPEVQAASEEDYLLPKNEYFSSNSVATLESTASVFDDENYDEDDEFEKERDMVDKDSEVQTIISSGDQGEHLVVVSESPKDDIPPGSLEAENLDVDPKDFQEEPEVLEEAFDGQSFTPLPILYVEDGTVILRFSEIFGVHEPLKKAKKRDHRYSIPKERYTSIDASVIVEEDEEAFLKGSFQALSILKETHMNRNDISAFMDDNIESEENGVVQGSSTMSSQVVEQKKNSCFSAEPMNEGETVDLSAGWQSPFNSKFYPLDQHDWENRIIWNNSPTASDNSAESCDISGPDSETMVNREIKFETGAENCQSELQVESDEKEHNFSVCSASALVEPFGSRNSTQLMNLPVLGGRYHPQLLRLESRLEVDNSDHSYVRKENVTEESCQSDALRRLSKLTLQNREIIEGSWLDRIIWEPHEPIVKPKLIFDLQDEQMLFEILDNKDGNHLQLHAGAMIITHSLKSSSGDSFELSGHGGQSGGRFNIANDKFYSNRESSPQLKSHSKKRTAHGVKVLHSTPALKLQTVKLRLNNKDIANFHRPKALWYPHDNEVALKELRKLTTHGGLMKVILKCLGGKGCRLHVDASETVSSVKAEASKKLDFKLSETVKIFFSGKELEDNKSLAAQNVQPNSLLHLVRTRIHLLPRAQKLPGENKSLRPPGAFKKKSDLSAKDGHVFLMEYCEERPLLLGNVGMGARLCTYYMKSAPGDNTGTLLRNENSNLGSVLTLDPADKSPFLGDIKPGCSQSSLETNMYRAPIFPHKVTSTDYLLVRSPKGKLSIRRIDRIDVVGQQEPHMEVMSPGTKGLQTFNLKRLLVYAYREFRTVEKHGLQPRIRADELSAQFPNSTEAYLRKQLKHCADFRRGSNGQMFWVMKPNFRIPSEEELRRMVTPENVCANESMLAGLYRLKHLGIMKLTNPAGISSAMNQLPDEAIALAAASHIERELQITPWNLTSNFVGRNNQGRENIERLEITGVGDPSGRGLGFSYVRTAPKAPISSAVVKKKTSVVRGGSTVTGTDADLRRLSMEAAREVLLKFNVQEEQIAKQTRWHRIAMIRKLSSEQAASGVKVDPTTISKYARGQRMSFLQLQQQTREKCQEIWDRQVQSLSAIEGDENESDSEANSDLDSFAGDLENLLDAEEGEEGEEGNYESKHEKADGVRGLKMRRLSSQAQAEEEIEDEAAEAADLCRMLVDEDEAERKKKKKTIAVREELGSVLGFGIENAERVKRTNTLVKQNFSTPQPVGPFASKENVNRDPKEVESFHVKKNLFGKVKGMKKNDISGLASFNKKVKIIGDGLKANIKGKKSARESFVCGACGQHGHMRTNKNCPKYGEDVDAQLGTTELDKASGGKTSSLDPSSQSQQKTVIKKLIPKSATKIALVEAVEGDNSGSKAKTLKFKCGSLGDKPTERPAISDTETNKSGVGVKVNKIIISNKMKPEDVQQVESNKPSIIIRPPTESAERDTVVDSDKSSRPPIDKPSIVIRPPTDRERSVPRKKIIIKQPKEIINLDQEGSTGFEYRKTKRIAELSSIEKKPKHQGSKLSSEELARRKARRARWEEEEEKRRNAERLREERARMKYEEEMRLVEEQERFAEISRYEEAIRREREEEERQKAEKRKKKKRKPETRDVYLEEEYQQQHGSSSRRRSVGGGDRRMPDRERSAKRRPVIELGKYGAEYIPPTKRRRVGEVGLANILEKMVEMLKERIEVSYLFLKPVSKKEAPDYLDIIEHPMDLSTIREKVRKLDYKSREEFRHDVWQITFNAHKYNDGRNPGIPPLADQLLELCDYLLAEHDPALSEAEAGIQRERHLQ